MKIKALIFALVVLFPSITFAADTNTTQGATTAYVQTELTAAVNDVSAVLAGQMF